MQLILSAMRRPATVVVLVLSTLIAGFLAVGPATFQQWKWTYPDGLPKGMEVDIFPKLNLPVIYVCQPYGGMDPAQMEGFLTNYYEYHFLYISGHSSCGMSQCPGLGADEAVLPSGHEHGPGDGGNHQLRQSLAGLHAAGHRVAVRHAIRHRQRASGLSGVIERHEDDQRDSRPGVVQSAADVLVAAGCVRAAAIRRQRPLDRPAG